MKKFECWWHGDDVPESETVIRNYPGTSDIRVCERCAAILDARTKKDWDEYYDELGDRLDSREDWAYFDRGKDEEIPSRKCYRCGCSDCICADSRY